MGGVSGEPLMPSQWITHKFGGTSLADAGAFRAVRDILLTPTESRQAVIVSATAGMPGHAVARQLLRSVGLADIDIERIKGRMTDHYDPGEKVLRLSEEIHDSASLAALAIVAHEAGHAIQDQVRYPFLAMRTAFVPTANISTKFGVYMLMGGIMLAAFTGSPFGLLLAWIGLVLYSASFAFTVITLPVEFDASRRALRLLQANGIVNDVEIGGAKKVLDAAALTYVAAMAAALMNVLYWGSLLGGRRK